MMQRNKFLSVGMVLVIVGGLVLLQLLSVGRDEKKILLPNGSTLTVELAQTEGQKIRGLSGRRSLSPDRGMLFVFSSPDRYRFWMKDMEIPLDFIWLKQGEIIELRSDVLPPSRLNGEVLDVLASVPFDAVLEANAGTIDREGLRLGDRLQY